MWPHRIQFLRHLKDFFRVMFKMEVLPSEVDEDGSKRSGGDKVLLTCISSGFTNLSKTTTWILTVQDIRINMCWSQVCGIAESCNHELKDHERVLRGQDRTHPVDTESFDSFGKEPCTSCMENGYTLDLWCRICWGICMEHVSKAFDQAFAFEDFSSAFPLLSWKQTWKTCERYKYMWHSFVMAWESWKYMAIWCRQARLKS